MGYKVEQRQIPYHGRMFHFVSYEGQAANVARGHPATLDRWFLMSAGTRWEVMPQVAGEEPADTDRRLLEWLQSTISDPPDVPAPTPAAVGARRKTPVAAVGNKPATERAG